MTTPRKTPNPFKMDEWHSPSVRGAWDDGYKCGHSDAEMDARGRVADFEIHASNRAHEVAELKYLNSNLIEKNDNQVKTIKRQSEQVNKLRTVKAALSLDNDRLRAEIADEKRIVKLFAEDKRLLADEVKRLTKDNSARGNSILDAQAKIRQLEANVDGNKEMYDDGLRDGFNNAVTEMVTHMQSMGGTVKFLTACQYSQLEDINANIGAKTGGIENNAIVIEEQVTLLGEVLGDIESPPR